MLVGVDLGTIFNTVFIGMCMICAYTKFHMPNLNGAFVVAVKQKAKYLFQAATMLLPYSYRKKKSTLTNFQSSFLIHNFRALY
jgi:hypothetical protein